MSDPVRLGDALRETVGQWHTLSDMTARNRERQSTWFDTDDLNQIRALADTETEGNVSLMLRKLVREALSTRKSKAAMR